MKSGSDSQCARSDDLNKSIKLKSEGKEIHDKKRFIGAVKFYITEGCWEEVEKLTNVGIDCGMQIFKTRSKRS